MATFSFQKRTIVVKLIFALIFLSIVCGYNSNSFSQNKNKYDPTTLVFPTFLHTYGIRKATRFHLFLFTQNKVKFNDPQGLAVVRLDSWEDTTTTGDDDEVTVYGVNSWQNNIIYSNWKHNSLLLILLSRAINARTMPYTYLFLIISLGRSGKSNIPLSENNIALSMVLLNSLMLPGQEY